MLLFGLPALQAVSPSASTEGRAAVVRYFGDMGGLVDTEAEMKIFMELSNKGLGPKLLGVIKDGDKLMGRVEEFLDGWITFTPAHYRDPEQLCKVARTVAHWHQTKIDSVSTAPRIFEDLGNLANLVEGQSDRSKERWASILGKDLNFLELASQLVQVLQEELQAEEVNFCHNDLQYGNIMQQESSGRSTLIDFEYSGYNPVFYDLANFFCEIPADYTEGVSPVGFKQVLDKSGFPSAGLQKSILGEYFKARSWVADDGTVEKFRVRILKFTQASHLFWGMWGILQARQRGDPEYAEGEFDYAAFSANRLKALDFQLD